MVQIGSVARNRVRHSQLRSVEPVVLRAIHVYSASDSAPACRRGKIIRDVSSCVIRMLRESIAGRQPPLTLADEQAWSQIKKYYAPLLSEMMNLSVSRMKIENSPIVNDRPRSGSTPQMRIQASCQTWGTSFTSSFSS